MRLPTPVWLAWIAALLALGGCAGVPKSVVENRHESKALASPLDTALGQRFARDSAAHDGRSAFRILSVGADGFATRLEMIDAASRSLDLQSFIFRADTTGKLLLRALLLAADRGVHVRLLLDDGNTRPGDEQIALLAAHPQIEVRIFNPFVYRGHAASARALEFTLAAGRLDYRMHNKVFITDDAGALIGGRNIGDEYFQVSPDGQLADDDVFVGGPMVQKLSEEFDVYWNCPLAIPVQALADGRPDPVALQRLRAALDAHWEQARHDELPFLKHAEGGEPWAGIVQGRLPLVWAKARLVYDSPEKQDIVEGDVLGSLMAEPVAMAARDVQSELVLVSPYFVPTDEVLKVLTDLRGKGVRVRLLTNSLESNDQVLAHSGYVGSRPALLQAGVELYELRARPEDPRGTGQNNILSQLGNFGLHAKLFIFDRQKLFVGSMNLDRRSARLNTEVGVIIDSAELAQQTLERFEAITRPANAYRVELVPDDHGRPALRWMTEIDGRRVTLAREPARDEWQRLKLDMLRMLPLDDEL